MNEQNADYALLETLVCRCGHKASDHHVSWFPGGEVLIEECESWDEPCDCEHFRRGVGVLVSRPSGLNWALFGFAAPGSEPVDSSGAP